MSQARTRTRPRPLSDVASLSTTRIYLDPDAGRMRDAVLGVA